MNALLNDPNGAAEHLISEVMSGELTEQAALDALVAECTVQETEHEKYKAELDGQRLYISNLFKARANILDRIAQENSKTSELSLAAAIDAIGEASKGPDFSLDQAKIIAEAEIRSGWLRTLFETAGKHIEAQSADQLRAEYREAQQAAKLLAARAELAAFRVLVSGLPIARENGQVVIDVRGEGEAGELYRQASAAQDNANAKRRALDDLRRAGKLEVN